MISSQGNWNTHEHRAPYRIACVQGEVRVLLKELEYALYGTQKNTHNQNYCSTQDLQGPKS